MYNNKIFSKIGDYMNQLEIRIEIPASYEKEKKKKEIEKYKDVVVDMNKGNVGFDLNKVDDKNVYKI